MRRCRFWRMPCEHKREYAAPNHVDAGDGETPCGFAGPCRCCELRFHTRWERFGSICAVRMLMVYLASLHASITKSHTLRAKFSPHEISCRASASAQQRFVRLLQGIELRRFFPGYRPLAFFSRVSNPWEIHPGFFFIVFMTSHSYRIRIHIYD